MIDTMMKDGLIDAFHGYAMGNTAENVAKQYQITREQQDIVRGGNSQNKASAAQKAGRFTAEISARHDQDAQGGNGRQPMTNISVTTPRPR